MDMILTEVHMDYVCNLWLSFVSDCVRCNMCVSMTVDLSLCCCDLLWRFLPIAGAIFCHILCLHSMSISIEACSYFVTESAPTRELVIMGVSKCTQCLAH